MPYFMGFLTMKSFPHIVDKMSLTFFQTPLKSFYPHVIHKILGISFLPVLLKTFLIYIIIYTDQSGGKFLPLLFL